ncbi:Uncharacterised protein [Escherichia coli]|nr:Uncharacterised protein [Escherichia coli]
MWENNDSSIRTGNTDGLLCQCQGDICSKAFSRTGREFAELVASNTFNSVTEMGCILSEQGHFNGLLYYQINSCFGNGD